MNAMTMDVALTADRAVDTTTDSEPCLSFGWSGRLWPTVIRLAWFAAIYALSLLSFGTLVGTVRLTLGAV